MKPPKEIVERIKRGRERMNEQSGMRSLCIDFYRGDQYGAVAGKGQSYQPGSGSVAATRTSRNKNRVRQDRNHIKPIIDEKVSAATSQVPGYEVIPSTNDYEDITAAQLAEKVAVAGHRLWRIRPNVRDAVWYALVADEGFVYPYWDSTVGPFIEDTDENGEPTGQTVGMGEVRLRAFGGNEAFWEPGARFEDSRWHAIENARPITDLTDDPDYIGPKDLKPDAIGPKSKRTEPAKLIMVTDYFERPCLKYPDGRHIVIANGQVCFKPETFPVKDQNGNVVDAPPFLRIAYSADPDSDRDLGLVRQMLDAQRALNDGENKIADWIRLTMAPQLLAAAGSLQTRPTNNPGDITFYNIIPGMPEPKWRETPRIPAELFSVSDRAKDDLRTFAGASDMNPSSITSGSEANALVNQQQTAWSSFLGDLADMYADLGTRCLALVQRHYTEERTMPFEGRQGWDAIADFKGADLRGQTDCRVNVATIEPRTRQSIKQEVMNIAQTFPGYFAPEVIISALKGGTAEKLIDTFQNDVRRANSVIRKIKAGVLMQEPMRPTFPNEEFPDPEWQPPVDEMGQAMMADPMTGEPFQAPLLTEVPGWMPRPFDGIPVHKATFEDWMKSDEYEALEDDQKEQAHLYYSALLDLESRAAQRNAEMQAQQAQSLGMENATKPSQPGAASLPAMPAT